MKLLIIFAIFYAILSISNVIAAENIDCSTIKNEDENSFVMNKSIDTNGDKRRASTVSTIEIKPLVI